MIEKIDKGKFLTKLLTDIENNLVTDFIESIIQNEKLNEEDRFDIQYDNDILLRQACYFNRIEIVKFLLTSKVLSKKANIHTCDEECLVEACQYGYLEIIEYLLTSPELSERADIYSDNCAAFIIAINENQTKVIDYLIFDYKIEISSYAENYLIEHYPSVIKKINSRDISNKLSNQLSPKRLHQNKNKI